MKTKTIIFAVLAAIAVMLVACETPTSTQTFPATYKLTPEHEIATRDSGLYASSRAHLLKQGMPEAEVVSLIGNPNKVSIRTCRPDKDDSWTCKIHDYTSPKYGYSGDVLYEKTRVTVYYYQFLDDWYLNSFITY